MAVTVALTGGSVEQGLLAGGEAVLLVSVEQGLMRCVTAELCKTGSGDTSPTAGTARGHGWLQLTLQGLLCLARLNSALEFEMKTSVRPPPTCGRHWARFLLHAPEIPASMLNRSHRKHK